MRHQPVTSTTRNLTLAAALLLSAGAAAAAEPASAPPGPSGGSCSNPAGGMCVEYVGTGYQATAMRRVCESQKLVFLTGACPAAARVGRCALAYKGKGSESVNHYYPGFPGYGAKPKQGVVAAAQEQCTQLKGQWTAG